MTDTNDDPPALDGARHALFFDIDCGLIEIAPEAGTVRLKGGGPLLLERAAMALDGALGLLSGRHPPDAAPPPDLDTARRRLHEHVLPSDPLRLVDEQAALTIEFRDAPGEAERAGEIASEAIAGLDGVEIASAPKAFVIRPRSAPVGPAMLALLAASPFKGRAPVFVGGSTGDEAGFRAAAQAGGYGVKVGPGETGARYRLADVAALCNWLARPGART